MCRQDAGVPTAPMARWFTERRLPGGRGCRCLRLAYRRVYPERCERRLAGILMRALLFMSKRELCARRFRGGIRFFGMNPRDERRKPVILIFMRGWGLAFAGRRRSFGVDRVAHPRG